MSIYKLQKCESKSNLQHNFENQHSRLLVADKTISIIRMANGMIHDFNFGKVF